MAGCLSFFTSSTTSFLTATSRHRCLRSILDLALLVATAMNAGRHSTAAALTRSLSTAKYIATNNGREFLQTLVHECCHLWQAHFGRPGKRGYHNKEWAEKMLACGLEPVNIGSGGSATTGYRVSDKPIDDGCFITLYDSLCAQGYEARWSHVQSVLHLDDPKGGRAKRRSKTKYTCPVCNLRAWAKPTAKLVCGECLATMAAEPLK